MPTFSHRPKVGSVQMERNGSCVFYFKLAVSEGCICNLKALDLRKKQRKTQQGRIQRAQCTHSVLRRKK